MAARKQKKKLDLNESPIRGILTASDSPFFPSLKRLVVTLAGAYPLCVMDLGLLSEECGWLVDRGAMIIREEWPCPKTINNWQTWNKPFYIAKSPFDKTLWLDADCVIKGDLTPLFRFDPLIVKMQGNWPQNANDWRLYQMHPTKERLPTHGQVNAGVLGFSRESIKGDLFSHWEQMVKWAIADLDVRKLLMFQDNGALLWAIEASSSAYLIVDEPGWNRLNHREFRPQPDDVIHHYVHWSWRALPPVTE